MSKVYGVFYTSTANVLVGYGGASGNPLVEREGPHLPGGTIDGSQKSAAIATGDILKALSKEVKEEFGQSTCKELEKWMENCTSDKIYSFDSYGHKVYIVYVNIDEYTSMYVDGKVIDGTSTKHDQCFSEVNHENIDVVLKKFAGQTDWFKDALKELKKRHFNGL